MLVYLKAELLKKFGSQCVASKALEIPESILSRIVRGHRNPSEKERGSLEKSLGRDLVRRVMGETEHG